MSQTLTPSRPTVRTKPAHIVESVHAHPRVVEAQAEIRALHERLRTAEATVSTLEGQRNDHARWARDDTQDELTALLSRLAAAVVRRDSVKQLLAHATQSAEGAVRQARRQAAAELRAVARPQQAELLA